MISTGIILFPLLSYRDHLQIWWALKFSFNDEVPSCRSQNRGGYFVTELHGCKLTLWPILILLTAAAGQSSSV